MHPELIVELLVLLAAANGTPILATHWIGSFLNRPLDGGRLWIDGRAIFGASKTLRGLLLSLSATSALAAVTGMGWTMGGIVAAVSMAGDLGSSFTKRRLGLSSSSRATGLDQIPESLLPLLAVARPLALSGADVAVCVVVFFVGEILISRVLYRMHIRERPY